LHNFYYNTSAINYSSNKNNVEENGKLDKCS